MGATAKALSTVSAVVLLAACGTEDEPTEEPTPGHSVEPTQESTPTPSPEQPTWPAPEAEAPPLAEAIEQLWDAAAEQETVTVEGELHLPVDSDLADQLLEDEEDNDDDDVAAAEDVAEDEATEPDEEQDNDDAVADELAEELFEPVQLSLTGSVRGEGTAYHHQVLGDYLLFEEGQLRLQAVESFIEDYDRAADEQGVEAQISGEELQEAFAPEVEWIEVSTPTMVHAETVEEFLAEVREILQEELAEAEIDEEAVGQLQDVEGEEMWVYEEPGLKLMVNAQQDEPLLESLETERIELSFSKWNDTQRPERPDDEQIIYVEELNDVLAPLLEQ